MTAGYRKRRRHPGVTVLRDVELTARAGELITLIGPNGAGKSRLLRTLVGAQPPLAGRILLDGQDLTTLSPRDRAQRLAVVLTEQVDVGWMTVEAVVKLGRMPYRSWIGGEKEPYPVGTSFRRWARLLAAEAHAPRRTAELEHWRTAFVRATRAARRGPRSGVGRRVHRDRAHR